MAEMSYPAVDDSDEQPHSPDYSLHSGIPGIAGLNLVKISATQIAMLIGT